MAAFASLVEVPQCVIVDDGFLFLFFPLPTVAVATVAVAAVAPVAAIAVATVAAAVAIVAAAVAIVVAVGATMFSVAGATSSSVAVAMIGVLIAACSSCPPARFRRRGENGAINA